MVYIVCLYCMFPFVAEWLDDIGLPQYKDNFYDGRMDGRMLHYCTVVRITLQYYEVVRMTLQYSAVVRTMLDHFTLESTVLHYSTVVRTLFNVIIMGP